MLTYVAPKTKNIKILQFMITQMQKATKNIN